MEELQTDTLADYGKVQNQENAGFEPNRDNETASCTGNILNGCEEIDPLDLMDHCDNESLGSNSDIWKGSDSEDDNFENKGESSENKGTENPTEKEKKAVNEDDLKSKSNGETTSEERSVIEGEVPHESEKSTEQVKEKSADKAKNDNSSGHKESKESPERDESVNEPSPEDVTVNKDNDKTVENTTGEAASKEEATDSVSKDIGEVIDIADKDPEDKTIEEPAVVIDKDPEEKPTEEPEVAIDKDLEDKTTEEPAVDTAPEDKATTESVVTEDKDSNEVTLIEDQDPLAEIPELASETDPLMDTQTLSDVRPPNRNNQTDNNDDEQMDYDAEEDDDFDPSLLCPEVSMDVDENPVVTTNGPMPNDGERDDSPLPYEPVFSAFVDEVTGAEVSFNLSPEEQELRKRLYGPTNPIQYTRLHCTACNLHLGSALEAQNNRFVHPLLKALICKDCYHFYTSGEFDKDEDGSELYCRWCGQGGQVLCCAKCEYVFCKRCIRTNFGRKKMFEIRDSDNWECFRCSPAQLITQRIACYEFFEYVRREISRASTLNSSEIWSKDYSRCCQKKRAAAENGEEVKRAKKKKGDLDPDYNPIVDKQDVVANPAALAPSTSSAPVLQPYANVNKGIVVPKPPIQLMPRFSYNKPKDNDIEFVRQIPAPLVTIGAVPRPTYRTIIPSQMRPAMPPPPTTLVRIGSQHLPPPPPPQMVPTSNRILTNALHGRNPNANSMMKHEWFEKTVRAAARVNSHLSYTLTQLNKAQSQAASVEELAVVHNKLQEILSSSINSLIQIRKNLRTEFIAGIKTVRLPSKKPDLTTTDDDVIFVSAPMTMPMPSTSQMRTPPPAIDPLIIIDKSNNTLNPVVTTTERPRIKVKSVMELQNVPAECITIPDDTPPPLLAKIIDEVPKITEKVHSPVEVVCNGTQDASKDVDPLADVPPVEHRPPPPPPPPKAEPLRGTRRSKNKTVFNLEKNPIPEVKKMMAVKVNLERIDLLALQKKLKKTKDQ